MSVIGRRNQKIIIEVNETDLLYYSKKNDIKGLFYLYKHALKLNNPYSVTYYLHFFFTFASRKINLQF